MREQNKIAQKEAYSFLATAAEVRRLVDKGLLVAVKGNSSLRMAEVSFPYTRPAVKLFLERLAPQYKSACGEELIVTSLTRPLSRQPRNAHELSVHPAGMALDLRVSRKSSCRNWLEGTLRSLEARRVLQATRERRPAHYHIAVYPQYSGYVASMTAPKSAPRLARKPQPKSSPAGRFAQAGSPSYASMLPVTGSLSEKSSANEDLRYKVRSGDSLWSIARRYDLTIDQVKKANGLKRSTLKPGETLRIPLTAPARSQAEN